MMRKRKSMIFRPLQHLKVSGGYGAATGGHLKVLKWLKEKNCSWGQDTCCEAAMGGVILRFWNGRMRIGMQEILGYLPWNELVVKSQWMSMENIWFCSQRTRLLLCGFRNQHVHGKLVHVTVPLSSLSLGVAEGAKACPWDWQVLDNATMGGYSSVVKEWIWAITLRFY